MFERFTKPARECVVMAEQAARDLGHDWIGTEHLLLGVAEQPAGLAGRVLRDLGATPEDLRAEVLRVVGPSAIDRDALAAIGIDFDEVRRRAEETFGPGALDRSPRCRRGGAGGHLPFTPRSKKSLELSLKTAVRLGDWFIGSEHLLLGIAEVEEGEGAQILASWGLDRARLETAVEAARRGAA
jgi:ATP-dependent Clp protease ATP-binding subunit ClpA